ncbi:MAG: AMP-binding protein [Bacteroidia bacterium]|nr:AMP-binding protein [Bacteroidia bacterium]
MPDRPRTFLDYFYHWESAKPDAAYLRQPEGRRWRSYTWRQTGDEARRIAAALQDLGLGPQDRIGLISKNCAHWIIADLAIKIAGCVSVPVYPTLNADQLRQVLEHSGCKALFIGKLDSLDAVRGGVPEGILRIALPLCQDAEMLRWETLLTRYLPIAQPYRPVLTDLESIVYTSGTTAEPKGVMKTYAQTSAGIGSVLEVTRLDRIRRGRFFSYLPLNHDAERALVEGGSLINGGTVYFAESIATFAANLRAARPTIFLAVPRIWTRFRMGVLERIPQERLERLIRLPLLGALVKRRIRKALGLNDLKLAISGAAPIAAETIAWFKSLGVIICEGYGMTENSAICTINPPEAIRIGTVGKPYPGCELRIDPETQEILMRAPWVMEGYYRNPELTAQTLRGGWLHTGDMGEWTDEGYLRITGRVKDMFKTSKGEYIIPGPMERMFSSNTLIEQVCIAGYGQPQPFALVNLSDTARHLSMAEVSASLRATLEAVNAAVADYERINKVVVTETLWTVDNGLMTPTLKVRRNAIDARYRLRMEAWYNQGEDPVIWE